MMQLDKAFDLTHTGNSELACAWFTQGIKRNYTTIEPALSAFLKVTGRQKFLEPLYKTMMESPEWQDKAQKMFSTYRNNYHPIAQNMVSKIVSR